jgi:hypothetical protein
MTNDDDDAGLTTLDTNKTAIIDYALCPDCLCLTVECPCAYLESEVRPATQRLRAIQSAELVSPNTNAKRLLCVLAGCYVGILHVLSIAFFLSR